MSGFQYYIDLVIAAKRELIRFRFWVVALFTLVLLAVLFVGIKWPQKYTSRSTISVDVTNVIEPLLRGKAEVVDINVNEKIGDVISSRKILERAMLRMYPEAASYSPQRLEREVKRFAAGMEVVNVRRRSQTTVLYHADNPTTAYESLSAIVQVFLDDRAAEKQKVSSGAYNFINSQVVEYKKQLEDAEQRLKAFKSQSVDVSEADVKRRIADLTGQIKDLKVEIQETQERIRSTKSQLATESQYIEVRARNAGLEQRKQVLQDELDRLRLLYQDTYPDIVTLKRQLSEITKEITNNLVAAGLNSAGESSELPLYEELRKQVSANEVKLLTQKRRLQALETLLTDEQELADQVAEHQAELLDLTRDYDVTKSVYEEMLERKENARLTMALNNEGQGENYKLDEAPAFPLSMSGIPPLFIFLAAPLIALGAPLGLVAVYVFLDPRYRSAAKLQSAVPAGVQFMGKIPYQSTPLSKRLMRKDMIILSLWVLCLMGFYGYLAYLQLMGQEFGVFK